MLGGLNPLQKQATIIGGGFAGMLTAYRLGQWGYEVALHEKGPWLGGLLGTTAYPYGMVEHAAHSLRASKPVMQLCEELGVELAPLRGSKSAYIFRDGGFRRYPLYVGETLAMVMRMLTRPSRNKRETLEEFGRRYMGEAAVDYLLTPMAFGIYGARPSELMVPEAFPRFRVEEGRNLLSHMVERAMHRRDKASIVAPKHGMSDLVQKLDAALRSMPNIAIHTNSACDFLEPAPNRILAVPAHAASKLLMEEDPATAKLLEKVRYAPLVTATVFIDREAMRHFPGGIGVLIPEVENIPVLGILFNSSSFGGRVTDPGLESLTVLCGGTPHPELINRTDAQIEEHITQALDRLFGLKKPPLKMHITKWMEAIPLYDANLALAQQRLREGWGALLGNVLVGNYTGQVSIRGMIEDSLHFEDNE